MSNQSYPYLCGGVFLTYLMATRKARVGVREHFNGDSDGLSDPELLEDFIKVIYPAMRKPKESTFKQNTSAYKNCSKDTGTYLPFDKDSSEVRAFDDLVRNHYATALSRMSAFIDKYLEFGSDIRKGEDLVKALVEIIDNDGKILSEDEFYIEESGVPSTKDELTHAESICFQSFIVGVWHYILMHRSDNTIGRSTIENWKPTYTVKYLKHITYAIKTEPHETDTAEEPIVETADFKEEQNESDASSSGATQTVNNPTIFHQYGANGTQIGSVGTLIIKHDK